MSKEWRPNHWKNPHSKIQMTYDEQQLEKTFESGADAMLREVALVLRTMGSLPTSMLSATNIVLLHEKIQEMLKEVKD